MSPLIFLDTSGWLAAVNPKDGNHQPALDEYEALVKSAARFVTSNLVLAEMHALIVRERGPKAGVQLLDAIYADPLYRVVAVDRDLESRAIDNWLRKFTDVRLSLADAASFQIMKDEKIEKAFALDAHFATAGFLTLPALPAARRRKPRS